MARPGFGFFVLLASLLALIGCAAEDGASDDGASVAVDKPPVEARARVDRAVATTGDVITYSVTLDYDASYVVELPDPGSEIAGFRIVDIGGEEPVTTEGRTVEERWYQLRADLVGSYVLPPVTVEYRSSEQSSDGGIGGEPETIQTSEIFVEVETVLSGDETDIRQLKPLRRVETGTPWELYAAAGGGALLLALLGWWMWRRRRNRPAPPPRPAHEIAFEALDRLRGTDFTDVEAMRRFHFEISEVVRAYVEARFALNATDLTTEEIVDHLDELRTASCERDRLGLFLRSTDRVKFADHRPPEDEIQNTYEHALSFVEATRERLEDTAESSEQAAPRGGDREAQPETGGDDEPPMEVAA